MVIAGCSTPRPAPHFSAPNSAPVQKQLAAAKSHADAAKKAIAEKNFTLANQQVDALLDELVHTQSALIEYIGKVETQTTVANTAIDEKNEAIASADEARRRYHRLKFPVCLFGAALSVYFALRYRLLRFIPPPYNLVGVAVLPGLIYSALWIYL